MLFLLILLPFVFLGFVLDSIVDSLCGRTGLNPDCVCLFFIFKIVFPPEGVICIRLGLAEAGFLLLLGVQAHPLIPVPGSWN